MSDDTPRRRDHDYPSVDDHDARIRAYSASYARSHATAYTARTRSGYFYLRRFELVREELARRPAGGELLDVGCGVGHAGVLAAEHGARYTGVDLSPEMLAQARVARFNPDASYALGSVESLPFDPDRFDIVLALGILEYVRIDRRAAAMAEIARVLKPGGLFVTSLLNRTSPAWVMRGLRGRASLVRSHLLRRERPVPFPEELFSRKSVRALIASGGLQHLRTVGYSMTAASEPAFAAHPNGWARVATSLECYGSGPLGRLAMGHLAVAVAPGGPAPQLPTQRVRSRNADRAGAEQAD